MLYLGFTFMVLFSFVNAFISFMTLFDQEYPHLFSKFHMPKNKLLKAVVETVQEKSKTFFKFMTKHVDKDEL